MAGRRPIAINAARQVIPSEHDEQATFVKIVRQRLPELAEHMAAMPNGGHRHKKTAIALKAEGVSDGYPDLLFDVPRGPFHGLRIEMKRVKSSPSLFRDSQRQWARQLLEAGYAVALSKGCDAAFAATESYWNLGPFDPACDLAYQPSVELWEMLT